MMMIAAAGHGYERRALYEDTRKPIPRWVWGAVGVSILAHAAGAVWLYNQRYEMPVEQSRPIDDVPIITMERLIEPDPPVVTPEPPAPQIPVHRPTTILPTTVDASPIPIPDEPTTAPVGEGPINLDPGPAPETPGTATDPTPPSPPVIRHPEWVRQPTAAQMERAYPRRALSQELSGRAVLSCSVLGSGEVTACSVVSQTPAGAGFGDAALSLSRYFRLSPRTVDGQTVEGARVTIPISFNLG